MHDVGGAIGHEGHALHIGRQPRAAIDQGRGDAAIVAGGAVAPEHLTAIAAVEPERGVRRPDVGLFLINQIFIQAARAHQIGIAREIAGADIVHKQRIGVDVAIDAPGIILRHTPLPAPQARHGDKLALPRSGGLVRQVPLMLGHHEQIVHAPIEPVGAVFEHAQPGKTVRQLHLAVGDKIAIGVACLPQRGRLTDQRAAICQHLEGARQHQLVGKHGALVVNPVIVGVVQHDQAVDRLQAVFHGQIVRPARQFHHPQPAIAIMFDQDRILDQRFGGDQLDGIARRHGKAFQRVGGGQHRRLVRLGGLEIGPGPAHLAAQRHRKIGGGQQQRRRQRGNRSPCPCLAM